MMIINEQLLTNIGGLKNNLYYTYSIPLKELSKIRFENKPDNVWMFFTIKDKKKSILKVPLYQSDNDTSKHISRFSIMLESDINSNELKERLTKAFSHLIKLNGGTIVEERF